MEGNNEAPHDIENPNIPLATSMSRELFGLPSLSASLCSIYRVPEELRCVNEKAYTPQVVSIGPIHHGKEGLKDMEKHKKRYLRYFLERTEVSLEDYVKRIEGKEAELRSCYQHAIELSSDEFVRIILVDAAFIIELLLRDGGCIVPDINDRIFHKPWLINIIRPDMLLLENQLPFSVLENVFAAAGLPRMLSVFDLSYHFCEVSTSLYLKRDGLGSSSSFKVEHFVDLIRTLNLPTDEEGNENRGSVDTPAVPSMAKLKEAGVEFKARSRNNLFDIRFKDGILEIPNLIIEDHTECVLQNLIAYEQCHCSDTHYFNDYIFLMYHLVNTPYDVELLVTNGIVSKKKKEKKKNGIVEHLMYYLVNTPSDVELLRDNNEVSTLINSLGKCVEELGDKFYYATLTKALNNYCENPKLWKKWKAKWQANWSTWKADLVQDYFGTPWKTISVIAATLLLILTFIQTVCSISQCARSKLGTP